MMFTDPDYCPVNAQHLYDTKPLAETGGNCIYCQRKDTDWIGPVRRLSPTTQSEDIFDREGNLIAMVIEDFDLQIWKPKEVKSQR